VAKRNTGGTVSVTLSLPRSAWPAELNPPARPSPAALSLLRGRLTTRQAVLLIRVDGSDQAIQEAVQYWQCSGFRVEEGDLPDPLGEVRNLAETVPSLSDRGSPSRGFRDPFLGSETPQVEIRPSEDESTSGMSG